MALTVRVLQKEMKDKRRMETADGTDERGSHHAGRGTKTSNTEHSTL
jgi:hypothetical protein